MTLNFDNLARCIQTLDRSLYHLEHSGPDSEDYEMYRNAVIKGFELTLETSGKLLRKVLREYMANPNIVNSLVFKDVFRQAAHYNLMSLEEVERWFTYRDSRNDTAHDYGVEFAEKALNLIKNFLPDAKLLHQNLSSKQAQQSD
ncbi:MAG: HI0074 family nucleotidyltransferase substrate-binding subunit [Pseudomonadota bacterium]|nr:HI0074 family nucleotidyltransferase substrate-binding subunit [Pseudomonadota bacterium]